MKKRTIAVLILLLSIFLGCNTISDTEVGSEDDIMIQGMSFVVLDTYIENGLVAEGRVTNNGASTATTPWHVEAQFYTDSTLTTKLGGNSTTMNFPLEKGQNTFWKISFSSQNVNVQQFPNFKVSDLRAVYKN